MTSNIEISRENAEFWNELCGTGLAKFLGITDSSPESLKKFDDWYFDFYLYLFDHIPFQDMNGKNVLEIGLGYGTVSQRLAESVGAGRYTGLDIAAGPVDMVNHRLQQAGLPGIAVHGSILNPTLPENTFDFIVAIGCLHHTGNLQLAIENCRKLLHPGGRLIFMVYYAYSYRRFKMAPLATLKTMCKEAVGYRGVVGASSSRERAAYDAGSSGNDAPHTDWISVRSLREYCKNLNNFSANIENIDQETPFKGRSRKELLGTRWASLVGLDLYATAEK